MVIFFIVIQLLGIIHSVMLSIKIVGVVMQCRLIESNELDFK